jgi:hypothetical protein
MLRDGRRLCRALKVWDWRTLIDNVGSVARQEADRARGVYRGMGLCCVVESCPAGIDAP